MQASNHTTTTTSDIFKKYQQHSIQNTHINLNDATRRNLKESRNTYTHRSINDLALKENYNYLNFRNDDELQGSAVHKN
jgi:hypothetical protein